ncbi:hypothetical protein L1887_44767 [Cichorium endivia]|nr:hypothetical protein L1887_44767 [Cichorium endivia]
MSASTAALAAPDSCERVKSDIQQKIINNGVPESGFTLSIVPNDQADQAGTQVVGHCANDTFKILYTRTGNGAAEAHRRTLVKSTAIVSLALAAGGISLPFGLKSAAAAVKNAVQPAEDKVVWGACSVNCGSRCALRLHVRDDEVYWVETDNTGEDIYGNHQVRACLRGRSIRRRINHPDRLNYPMKRVGKRGEGKFERITWDEALDAITASLKEVVSKYGNEAVYINYSSGIVGGNITRSSPYASLVARLMNCYGGFLSHYGTYSTAQIACAMLTLTAVTKATAHLISKTPNWW